MSILRSFFGPLIARTVALSSTPVAFRLLLAWNLRTASATLAS